MFQLPFEKTIMAYYVYYAYHSDKTGSEILLLFVDPFGLVEEIEKKN